MRQAVFDRLFRRRRQARAAAEFFATIVERSRDSAFYRELGVPDTLDGRFDMVVLHLVLIMRRLKGQGPAAEEWSRLLFEAMIDNFEKALTEQGVGDSGVSRRIKTMARAVAGRIQVYDRALAGQVAGDSTGEGGRDLEVALDNNVYGSAAEVRSDALAALAAYVRREAASLAATAPEILVEGRFSFGPTPAAGAGAVTKME